MWYAQIQETLTLFQLISASSCKVTTRVYKSGEFTVDMPPMYKVFKDRQVQTKAVDELTEMGPGWWRSALGYEGINWHSTDCLKIIGYYNSLSQQLRNQ